MLKLYKRIKRALHYHEAWADSAKVMEHWGKVGERGENAQHKRNRKLSEEQNLKQVLSTPLAEGYQPIGDEEHAVLLVEYAIDGMGNTKDLDKRHALEERMNETLGWTGLGYCDGGSIGSGTMDVCCFVVDFKIAKRVIEKDLKNTEFADYSRIFDERAGQPASAPDRGREPAPPNLAMLMPPWLMYQGRDRQDASWRKGKPAAYLANWLAWYQSVPAEARVAYAMAFREPKEWAGFYQSSATSANR
jgi:hypothetical protein